jgi:peptide/nickel transport system substrate-binding protein
MKKAKWGASLAFIAVALTGCSSGAGTVSVAEDGNTDFRTGQPTTQVDSVSWYTFYRPVLGLVSATWMDYPELMVNANLCESIVRVEPDFSIVPGLTDFEVSDDYTTYTYTIRNGAAFWDGTPVTTDDIIFSIGANTSAPFGAGNFQVAALIKSIDKTSENSITITLTQPDLNFNASMGGAAGKVYQKAQAEQAGDTWGNPEGGVMCSGPYTLGQWDPASSLTIIRNDNYWGPDFDPLVKQVVFSWPQDPTTLSNAFQSGEIMGGWNIPPSILVPMQNAGAGQMYVGSTESAMQMYALIVSNLTDGPLANPAMRQAISALIDRDAIASKVYNGAAVPLYALTTPGSMSYEKDAFAAANESAKSSSATGTAAELAKQAGYDGTPLVLALPAGDSLATTTAKAIQTDGENAGITIEILPMEASDYAGLFFDPAAREGIDLFFTIYAPTVRDPLQNYFETLVTGQVNNFNGYSNPEVDSLINAARVSLDKKFRAENVVKAQEIFLKDMPYITITSPRVTVWEGEGITGAPTTFTWTNSPWAALLGGK